MRRCHLRWNRPEEAVLEGGGGDGEEEQQQQNAHPRGWTTKHSAEYSKTDFVNDHAGNDVGYAVAPRSYYEDTTSSGKTQWHHPYDEAPRNTV